MAMPRICNFYNQGKCKNGNDCKFLHVNLPPISEEQCQFFIKGDCKYDDKCHLKHDEGYKVSYALKMKKAIDISQE